MHEEREEIGNTCSDSFIQHKNIKREGEPLYISAVFPGTNRAQHDAVGLLRTIVALVACSSGFPWCSSFLFFPLPHVIVSHCIAPYSCYRRIKLVLLLTCGFAADAWDSRATVGVDPAGEEAKESG
jgi:hypothetical protein